MSASLDSLAVPLYYVITFGSPFALLWWGYRRRKTGASGLFVALVSLILALTLAVAIWGWYVKPDYAGSPMAMIGSTAVLQLPALIAMTLFVRATDDWPLVSRFLASLGIMAVLFAALRIPAMVVFVMLGGDTL